MYSEPRIVPKFVIFAVLTAVFGILAWKIERPDWARAGLLILSSIFGLLTFVYGGDIIIDWISRGLQKIRNAWYAPQTVTLGIIARMNDRQLAFASSIEPVVKVGVKIAGEGPEYVLLTPTGNLPMDWVSNYLDRCAGHYPNLIVQHGLSDNVERQRLAMFNSLMIHTDLAEDAVGNKAARWTVPMETVYRKLGFE